MARQKAAPSNVPHLKKTILPFPRVPLWSPTALQRGAEVVCDYHVRRLASTLTMPPCIPPRRPRGSRYDPAMSRTSDISTMSLCLIAALTSAAKTRHNQRPLPTRQDVPLVHLSLHPTPCALCLIRRDHPPQGEEPRATQGGLSAPLVAALTSRPGSHNRMCCKKREKSICEPAGLQSGADRQFRPGSSGTHHGHKRTRTSLA